MGSGCSSNGDGSEDSSQYASEGLRGGQRRKVGLEMVDDPSVSSRPWQINEKVALISTGFASNSENSGESPSTPVVASMMRRFSHVYVILDGQWWAGEVTRVSQSGKDDKMEVRLFGAKRNAPAVVVNLTSAQYRLRHAPSGDFFALDARLEVLDQFVSKKTKRYKEQWRSARIAARDAEARVVQKVQIAFDGWGPQHNIWLDVVKDASRLRPHIDHAPRGWALSYFRGGRVGLNNMGNTCYLNAALQCLAHIRPLALYFLSGQYKQDLSLNRERSSSKGKIAVAFAQVVTMLWYGRDEHSVSPSALKKAMSHINSQFAGYRQHDAQEFLCFLLDALHEDLNRVETPAPYEELDRRQGESVADFSDRCWHYDRARSDSYVKDLFCGQLHSTITCRECGAVSTCFDPFWNLSIPIPKTKGAGDGARPTVESCIRAFSTTEELDGDDMYFCGKCKTHCVSSKTIKVWRAPRVLVLHLRRFAQRGSHFHKANAPVDFPVQGLNLGPYIEHEASAQSPAFESQTQDTDGPLNRHEVVYNLNSFASHIGVANDGHYLATCQCPGPGPEASRQWVLFNDDLVEPVGQIAKKKAYLLFYIRAHREDEYINTIFRPGPALEAHTEADAASDSYSATHSQSGTSKQQVSGSADRTSSRDGAGGGGQMVMRTSSSTPRSAARFAASASQSGRSILV